MPHALILFAHGARDREWAEPFRRLQAQIRALLPDAPVELAFLDLMQPDLEQAAGSLVAMGIGQICIVPVFLAQGSHLKRDLPVLVEGLRQRHPGCSFRVTPTLGEQPEIIAALAAGAARLFKANQ